VKVAVVGTLLWDSVHPWRGPSREGPGGIGYNIVPLASLAGEQDIVVPVCWLGDGHLARFRHDWGFLEPRLDLSLVSSSARGSDTNELRYESPTARQEVMRLRCPPLDPGMLHPVLDADLIHFNAITGKEFTLRTVRQVATEATGLLMLDVHCLVCRLNREGHLTRGRWTSWHQWAKCFHLFQCNEEELALMLGENAPDLEALAHGAVTVLDEGPECVILTLGSRGSLIAARENGTTRCWHTPGLVPAAMGDPTGCGDCFSAGFIHGYLRWKDLRAAAILGTVVATTNCAGVGLEAFASPEIAVAINELFARERDRLQAAQTSLL
jgi:sugar/nucleoside kinase (ribokinase family)